VDEAGPSEATEKASPKPGEPQQGQEPKERFQCGPADVVALLSLPLRHSLYSFMLHFMHRSATAGLVSGSDPDAFAVYGNAEFYEGVQEAIQAVFGYLASGDFDALEGLVNADLQERLQRNATEVAQERWSEVPELSKVQVNGILGAQAIQSSGVPGDSRIQVTLLVGVNEKYQYTDDLAPVLLRRFQRWTFEREVAQGRQWTVTNIEPECWHWRRPAGL